MNRISRLFSTAGGVALGGLRARITKIGGNEPMPYAFTDGGAVINTGDCWTSPLGIIDVYITSNVGARITVFGADNSVLFQQDIGVQIKPGTTVASDPLNEAVPAVPPAPVHLLVQGEFQIPEGADVTPLLFLVYEDGTFEDTPPFTASGTLTAASENEGVVTVDEETGTISAVASGTTTVTYTFTPTIGSPLTAEIFMTVTDVPDLAATGLFAQSTFRIVVGFPVTASLSLLYNNGTFDSTLPFADGVLTAVSGDTGVATVVAATGVITPVAAGTTTITWTFTPTVGTARVATSTVTVVAA